MRDVPVPTRLWPRVAAALAIVVLSGPGWSTPLPQEDAHAMARWKDVKARLKKEGWSQLNPPLVTLKSTAITAMTGGSPPVTTNVQAQLRCELVVPFVLKVDGPKKRRVVVRPGDMQEVWTFSTAGGHEFRLRLCSKPKRFEILSEPSKIPLHNYTLETFLPGKSVQRRIVFCQEVVELVSKGKVLHRWYTDFGCTKVIFEKHDPAKK